MAGKAAGKGKSLVLQHKDCSAFLSGAGFTLERERAIVPLASPCKHRLKEHCRSGCALSSQTTADAFANPTLGARLSFEAELCESPVSLSVFATRFTLWHQHVCSYEDRIQCLQDAGRCIVRQTQTH